MASRDQFGAGAVPSLKNFYKDWGDFMGLDLMKRKAFRWTSNLSTGVIWLKH
jgi:hypothetical protein